MNNQSIKNEPPLLNPSGEWAPVDTSNFTRSYVSEIIDFSGYESYRIFIDNRWRMIKDINPRTYLKDKLMVKWMPGIILGPGQGSIFEPTIGDKQDDGKVHASLLMHMGRALLGVSEVATYGMKKYNEKHDDPNFVKVPDGRNRYRNARWRHEFATGKELKDSESGLLHLQHIAWNALAELEIYYREQELDSD